ncbi:hypothetical protein AGR2A_Lc90180 [Agrobacterium genomosp. 2 str. CFBP 5494]|uniref:Uncharacterized protein n=1 Tax=Agrobacterium genomosp. 2 str. CFBP 5494 TaxID=1183436 RepID=A0A9W5F797_9HYPH|nr:hypothetical protein AGR2A_Lc90180 [Agrobacterium genomosp. 2 str. CFBP 5494]
MPVQHNEIVDTIHDGVSSEIQCSDRIHDNIEPMERGRQGRCHLTFVFNKQQAHEFVSALSARLG